MNWICRRCKSHDKEFNITDTLLAKKPSSKRQTLQKMLHHMQILRAL